MKFVTIALALVFALFSGFASAQVSHRNASSGQSTGSANVGQSHARTASACAIDATRPRPASCAPVVLVAVPYDSAYATARSQSKGSAMNSARSYAN